MQNKSLGSALISALFIMTLVAIAATAMSTRLRLDIYRTSAHINSDKLYLASQAVTWWAMDKLSAQNNSSNTLNTKEKIFTFPTKLQSIYPNVHTEGAVYDLQARFNVNNLQDKKFHALFYRLLENWPKKINQSDRKLIFDATTHWIRTNRLEQGADSFSSAYLQRNPPYNPGHQPMRNISEFRLVSGVTPDVYQMALPVMTALPEITPININTAPKAILMTLGNGLDAAQVKEILVAREESGGITLANSISLLQKLNIPKEQVTVESNYFLSIATTSSRDSHLTVYTVIKRTRTRQGMLTSIISESLNTP